MASEKRKKVLVSGCFDLLHSGHVKFFEEASKLGDVYVCLGTDANIEMLKHHKTMFPNEERLYMLQSLKYVHHARLSTGTGDIDFEPDLDDIKPDIFYVNEDGDRAAKRAVVQKRGIEFVVAERTPQSGLSARSSTQLKRDLKSIKQKKEQKPLEIPEPIKNKIIDQLLEIKQDILELEVKRNTDKDEEKQCTDRCCKWPWRLCIAGGWLDQPWVSKVMRGGVIVMNVDYHEQFKNRSGLATSTRNTAMKLWKNGLPSNMDNIECAKLLFGAENPPGTKYVSGSQDHLGLLLPGINRLDYKGEYWPNYIVKMNEEAKQRGKNIRNIYRFVERVLWLIPMNERKDGYDPLIKKDLSMDNVEKLADASEKVWRAILNCDAEEFGVGLTDTLKAWKLILPNTVPDDLDRIWKKYDEKYYGCLFTGCGGGFLMVIADTKPHETAFQVKVNDKSWWNNNSTRA